MANYIAAATLSGHWDSMIANGNNDFLFFNGAKKKWQVITWDLDNTLGALIDQHRNLMSDNLYSPARERKPKLFDLAFSEDKPNFRKKLKDRVKAFTQRDVSRDEFARAVETAQSTVNKGAESWEAVHQEGFNDIGNFVRARRNALEAQF